MALPPGYVPPKPPPPKDPYGHWADVDWEAILNADPEYHQAVIDEAAGLIEAGGARTRGIINALVNFGIVPDEKVFASMSPEEAAAVSAAITPDVAAKIAGNSQSFVAQTADHQRRAAESLRARLGSRGTFYGGAQSAGLYKGQNDYNQSLYTGGQTLLGALGTGETEFAKSVRDWATLKRTALGAAGGRISQTNPWVWVEGTAPGVTPGVPQPTPNPTGIPGSYGGVLDPGDEPAWPVDWGPGPTLVAPPQHNVPRVHPATRAVIARSAAMGRLYKKNPKLFR